MGELEIGSEMAIIAVVLLGSAGACSVMIPVTVGLICEVKVGPADGELRGFLGIQDAGPKTINATLTDQGSSKNLRRKGKKPLHIRDGTGPCLWPNEGVRQQGGSNDMQSSTLFLHEVRIKKSTQS